MQDLQATIQLVFDYLKGIWIKKRYIIISTWLICPIGLILVAQMPDVYESNARVFADTRSMLKPLLRGITVQSNPDDEIKMIARTLLSTPNLEDIARQADLDINANSEAEFRNIVASLRSNISLRPSGRDNIYSIAFEHEDPNKAKQIVLLTLDKFIESALGQNRKDSDTASKFLDQQIDEYARRLAQSEQRVAEFKKQYGELLAGDSYYQQRATLNNQIEKLDLELAEKETQLNSLKSKFKAATPNADNADPMNFQTQYDQRISQLQANLDDLLIRFTEQHPDVVQTKERLEVLVVQRKKEIQELVKGLSTGDVASGGLSENAIVQELTIVINNLESNIASLNVRKANFQEKLALLEDKIELVPDIEAKRTALNRDYGITKRKYEEFLARKESADISRKAEQSSEEVQFRIIEPPVVPLEPSGPNRLMFYTAVFIMSIGGGVVMAFITSQLNPVVVNATQLTNVTGRPVLGAVTDVNLEAIKKKNRFRVIIFSLSTLTVFCIYLTFLATELLLNTTPIKILEALL